MNKILLLPIYVSRMYYCQTCYEYDDSNGHILLLLRLTVDSLEIRKHISCIAHYFSCEMNELK